MNAVDKIIMLLGVEIISPSYKKTVQDFIEGSGELSDQIKQQIVEHLTNESNGQKNSK